MGFFVYIFWILLSFLAPCMWLLVREGGGEKDIFISLFLLKEVSKRLGRKNIRGLVTTLSSRFCFCFCFSFSPKNKIKCFAVQAKQRKAPFPPPLLKLLGKDNGIYLKKLRCFFKGLARCRITTGEFFF